MASDITASIKDAINNKGNIGAKGSTDAINREVTAEQVKNAKLGLGTKGVIRSKKINKMGVDNSAKDTVDKGEVAGKESAPVSDKAVSTPAPSEESFFAKNKKAILIGSGVAVVVIGIGVYFYIKNKKP